MMGMTAMRRMGMGVALAAILVAPAAMAAKKAPEPGQEPGKPQVTAEQKAKMKEMRQEHRKAMEPLQKKMQIQMAELKLLVAKDASDSELSAKIKEIAKTREAIRVLREKHMEEAASLMPVRARAEQMLRMGQGMGQGQRGMRQGRQGQGRGQGMGMGRNPDCPYGQAGPGKRGLGGPANPDDDGDSED